MIEAISAGLQLDFDQRRILADNLQAYREQIIAFHKPLQDDLIQKLDQSQRLCLQLQETITDQELTIQKYQDQNNLLEQQLQTLSQQIPELVKEFQHTQQRTLQSLQLQYQKEFHIQEEIYKEQLNRIITSSKQEEYDELLEKYGKLLENYQILNQDNKRIQQQLAAVYVSNKTLFKK